MEFDIEKDIFIFDELLALRPSIDRAKFADDLKQYYVPFVEKLLKLPTPAIVGVSAIQGAGKTTQGEIMEILLEKYGKTSVHLSIDDHYLTHAELNALRLADPRYIRRGVTHDLMLAIKNLNDLKNMTDGEPVLIAQYDKSAYQGDGERFRWTTPVDGLVIKGISSGNVFHMTSAMYKDTLLTLPENMGGDISFDTKIDDRSYTISKDDMDGLPDDELPKGWKIVTKKPDFIFYDGWMVGCRSVSDESVFSGGLPALESNEAQDFAKMINKKLKNYEGLWNMFDFLNLLYVPNYQMALEWRQLAEKPLQEKGDGMTPREIQEFVYYFWRSVHPAIQIKNLAMDTENTDQVVVIGDDHTVVEVLSPKVVIEKNL